jgi:hypothetical protein
LNSFEEIKKMKTRIAIIAACAGALVLTFSAASDTSAQSNRRATPKISDGSSPLPQDRKANRKNNTSNVMCCLGDWDGDGNRSKNKARKKTGFHKGKSSISDQGTIGGLIAY